MKIIWDQEEIMLPKFNKTVNFGKSATPAEAIRAYFPGHTNPDRFALVSSAFDKKENRVFVKIHGNFTTQGEAESVAANAMNGGYPLTIHVCDTRSWLPFPVVKTGKLVHANSRLEKVIGTVIQKENAEIDRMRERVENSRNTKPTTAFGRYKLLVLESAQKLIEGLKEEKKDGDLVDLKKKFEAFREKELAAMEQVPLDPVLANHFKSKIRQAANNDQKVYHSIRQAQGMTGPGMGLPSLKE